MSNWSISIDGQAPTTFAAAKIESGTIELVSRGRDQAVLYCHSSVAWSYKTAIKIYYDGTCLLAGRVLVNEHHQSDGTNADRIITIEGAKHVLDRITYCQDWFNMTIDGPSTVRSSRVILNAKHELSTISHISVGAQIKDIIDYAEDQGLNITRGTVSPALVLPYDETRDVTCRQAILHLLRLLPLLSEWCDYTSDPPEINYDDAATVFSPALLESQVTSYRDDLVVPGLTIEVERTHEIDGTQYRTLDLHTAGDPTAPEAPHISLQLAGRSFAAALRTLDVVTEAIGDIETEAWWKNRHPRLADAALADITLVSAERGLLANQFPRISATPLPDLTAAGLTARLETFCAIVDIIQRDDNNDIVGIEHDVQLTLEYVTTNAVTKTYRWTQGATAITQEEIPDDLATHLYAHWATTWPAGEFSCPLSAGIPHPGQKISSSPIQTIRIDIASEIVTGTFGPPDRLSATDFASYLSAFRNAPPVMRLDSRFDGRPAAKTEDDQRVIAPVSSSTWSPGAPTRTVYRVTGKSVDINAADLTSGQAAQFRDVTLVTPTGQVTAKLLSTSPAAESGYSEVSGVPVAIRVHTDENTLIQRIQVKYGKVLVRSIDDAWTDFLVPEPYDL